MRTALPRVSVAACRVAVLVFRVTGVFVRGSPSGSLKYMVRVKVTLRDPYSVRWFRLNGIGFAGLTPPPSLALTEPFYERVNRMPPRGLSDGVRLLIVPRAPLGRWRGKARVYAEVIRELAARYRGLEVVLMGQSSVEGFRDDDYGEIGLILGCLGPGLRRRVRVVDVGALSISEVFETVSGFDCVVSERAFAAVMGLSLRVPVIAVDPYGGKTLGLMELFGFGRFVIPLRELEASKVVALFEEVVGRRGFYRSLLDRVSRKLFLQAVDGTRRLFSQADLGL